MEIRLGYLEPKKNPKRWVLGAVQPPTEILQPDMDWSKLTPKFEPQNINFETYNCTGFNTLNALEMIHQRMGQTVNYSDRWLGIIAGTSAEKGGNDPETVAEAIRLHGLIPEEMLPWTPDLKNVEEYYSFKGADEQACREAGKKWLEDNAYKYYEIPPTVENIKEWLKRSPVCVSVNAWVKKGDKYTKNILDRDNHWTLNIKPQWLIEDSYLADNSPLKDLEPDYPFGFAMGYYLEPKELVKKKLTLLERLLDLSRQLYALLFSPPVKSVENVIINKVEEPKYKWGTKSEVRHSIRLICDEEGLSWANKNIICACIEQESQFNPKAIGKINKDGTQDFGLCQYNNGKNGRGQAYWIGANADFKNVDEVLNDPEKNVRVMIREFERGNLKYWSSYKTGAYKKYL